MPYRITETNRHPSLLVAGIDLEKGPAVVKYDFSGHVALVTGGTKGIGRSIALAFCMPKAPGLPSTRFRPFSGTNLLPIRGLPIPNTALAFYMPMVRGS